MAPVHARLLAASDDKDSGCGLDMAGSDEEALLPELAVSIAANIAEGFRKRGKADKLRFLNIAQGSLAELTYYFILSQDLGYADNLGTLLDKADHVA